MSEVNNMAALRHPFCNQYLVYVLMHYTESDQVSLSDLHKVIFIIIMCLCLSFVIGFVMVFIRQHDNQIIVLVVKYNYFAMIYINLLSKQAHLLNNPLFNSYSQLHEI